MTENGSPSQYKPNVLNQYDIGDGEMLQYGDEHELVYYDGNTFSYIGDTRLETVNGANRLGQMDNIEYKLGYDALGRCVKRVTDRHAKFFAYDGEKAILEFDENGQYIANTLYGRQMDEVLARDNNGSGQYFMQDRNLNTVVVTGGDGSVVESYRYDAFGAPTFYHYNVDGTVTADDKTQINNRFLFTGREWNGSFGFYEYRARAYHPVLGRFMSEDPIGFQIAGTKPSAELKALYIGLPEAFGDSEFNLYRYCLNNPLNKLDPTGLILIVDPFAPVAFQLIEYASLSIISQSPDGAAAIKQLQASPNLHFLTMQYSKNRTGATTPLDSNKATNGQGSGSIMKVNPFEASSSTETPQSKTAHEIGHGQDIDSGKAVPPPTLQEQSQMSPLQYMAHPSEANANHLETEVKALPTPLPAQTK